MGRRRIAMVSRYYFPFIAGAEQQVRLLAGLLQADVELCEVITTHYQSGLARDFEEKGVRIRRLWSWNRGAALINFFTAFFHFLVHARRYDVIQLHCLSSFCLGALLGARIRGIKTLVYICTLGMAGEIRKIKRSSLGPLLWWGFLRADGFISQTPTMVSELARSGVPEAKICTIPNLVLPPASGPTPKGLQLRRSLGLPERPVVLYVGRLHQEKGLDQILGAWPEILAQQEATLVLVGDGPEFARIERWRQDNGLTESVRLIGWREDPEEFYRAADVFVFPSLGEAFGNVLAEAMMHGLPVVTTPVGMAKDWLRDQENGLLLHSSAPSELAATVVALLQDPARRRALGQSAQRDALASFTPTQVVSSYVRLYENLSSEAKP